MLEAQPTLEAIKPQLGGVDANKRTYEPSGIFASLQTRICEYQQLRDAYALCAGTTEAKMRVRSMRDKYAGELEAAGVQLTKIGPYKWHEDERSPPAALRVRFSKKAIHEEEWR